MTQKLLLLSLLLNLLCTPFSWAHKKELAMTIDDLPFVGDSKNFHLNMIIDTITAHEIPATGFIIAKEVTKENWPVLQRFHNEGLGLGNHTLSHSNLNQMSLDAYIHEIKAADDILSPLLTTPKYFRYPYLVTGQGNKKTQVARYLSSQHYQVAPITIDSKDFMFNQLLLSVTEKERRHFLTLLKPCYLDFIWQQTKEAEERSRLANKPNQAQILLIHANLLNAYVLPDIIELYQQNGFRFISLQHALKTTHETQLIKTAKKEQPLTNQDAFMAWDESA